MRYYIEQKVKWYDTLPDEIIMREVGCLGAYKYEGKPVVDHRYVPERTCRFNVAFYQDFATPHQPGNICRCTACGYRHLYGVIVDARFKYCPNCGARIEAVE